MGPRARRPIRGRAVRQPAVARNRGNLGPGHRAGQLALCCSQSSLGIGRSSPRQGRRHRSPRLRPTRPPHRTRQTSSPHRSRCPNLSPPLSLPSALRQALAKGRWSEVGTSENSTIHTSEFSAKAQVAMVDHIGDPTGRRELQGQPRNVWCVCKRTDLYFDVALSEDSTSPVTWSPSCSPKPPLASKPLPSSRQRINPIGETSFPETSPSRGCSLEPTR